MSEDIKKLVQRYIDEIYTQGNLDKASEFVADDYVNHTPFQTVQGLDGLKQFVTMMRSAVPDLQETIEDQVAEGDKEVHRWVIRGTQHGEFMGIPASGQAMEVSGTTIARIVDGKIAEEWSQVDMLGMLQRAGVFSLPATSA